MESEKFGSSPWPGKGNPVRRRSSVRCTLKTKSGPKGGASVVRKLQSFARQQDSQEGETNTESAGELAKILSKQKAKVEFGSKELTSTSEHKSASKVKQFTSRFETQSNSVTATRSSEAPSTPVKPGLKPKFEGKANVDLAKPKPAVPQKNVSSVVGQFNSAAKETSDSGSKITYTRQASAKPALCTKPKPIPKIRSDPSISEQEKEAVESSAALSSSHNVKALRENLMLTLDHQRRLNSSGSSPGSLSPKQRSRSPTPAVSEPVKSPLVQRQRSNTADAALGVDVPPPLPPARRRPPEVIPEGAPVQLDIDASQYENYPLSETGLHGAQNTPPVQRKKSPALPPKPGISGRMNVPETQSEPPSKRSSSFEAELPETSSTLGEKFVAALKKYGLQTQGETESTPRKQLPSPPTKQERPPRAKKPVDPTQPNSHSLPNSPALPPKHVSSRPRQVSTLATMTNVTPVSPIRKKRASGIGRTGPQNTNTPQHKERIPSPSKQSPIEIVKTTDSGLSGELRPASDLSSQGGSVDYEDVEYPTQLSPEGDEGDSGRGSEGGAGGGDVEVRSSGTGRWQHTSKSGAKLFTRWRQTLQSSQSSHLCGLSS